MTTAYETLTDDDLGRFARLVVYCYEHQNTEDQYGLTCDERGCSICNADSPEGAAVGWWRAYEDGRADLPDGVRFGTGPLCEEDPERDGWCAYHGVEHAS